MIHFLIGMAIGYVMLQIRWAFTIFWAVLTVVGSFQGSLWTILLAFLFAAELVSAWTGESCVEIVWRAIRSGKRRDWTAELELASTLDKLDATRSRSR